MFFKWNFKQLNADAQESAGPDITGEATTATTTAPVEAAPPSAHDDFDWSVDKRNVTSYTAGRKRKV